MYNSRKVGSFHKFHGHFRAVISPKQAIFAFLAPQTAAILFRRSPLLGNTLSGRCHGDDDAEVQHSLWHFCVVVVVSFSCRL
jgi:hypothetical protein